MSSQETLREITTRLDILIESLPFGILLEDEARCIIYTNPAFRTLFEIPPEVAIAGGDWRETAQQRKALFAEPETFVRVVERAEGGRHPIKNEELSLADGRVIECDCTPVTSDGAFVGLLWQYRDVSERHEAGQMERAQEALLRSILDNAPVTLFAIDRSGTITLAKGKSIAETDLTTETVVGLSVFEILQHLSRTWVSDTLERVLAGKEAQFEIEFGEAAFEVRLTPARDASGSVTGLLGVAHDISERKQMEQALRRQNSYQAMLHETTLALVNRLEIDELLRDIVTSAAAMLGSEHGYLYLVDDDGETISVRYGSGLFNGYIGYRMVMGEGIGGTVWQTGEPLVVEDYDVWLNRSPNFDRQVIRAVVGAPMKSAGQVVGIIGVAHVEPGKRFDEDDAHLLSQFGELASLALDNARLYQSAQQEIAERKRTEEALRQSEERYRSIIETIDDGYYETDLKGNFTFVNDAFTAILGHPRESLLGYRYTRYSDASTTERVLQAFNSVYLTGKPVRAVEAKMFKRDREICFVEISISLARDNKGEAAGFRGIVRDITERKQMEQALQASEERYRSVIAAMAEGVMLHDESGRVTAYNETAKRVLRLADEQILGRTPAEMPLRYVREDGSPFAAENHPALVTLQSGRAQSHVVLGIEERGQVAAWISVNSQPIFREGKNHPHAVVTSFSDITVSKAADEALKRSERRNMTLLQAIPDTMLVLTRDGLCVECKANDRGAPFLLPPEQLIGLNVRDFPLSHEVQEVILASLLAALETGDIQTFVYGSEAESGYFEARMAALNDEEVLCIVRDVTERRQAELELNKRINVLGALQQVDAELNQTLSIEYVLAVALDATLRLSGANAGYIALADGDTVKAAQAVGPYPPLDSEDDPLHLNNSIVARVARTRRGALIADVFADPDYVALIPSTRAEIAIPMISHDTLVGVLVLESNTPSRFNNEIFRFLELLTARIAVAIDNARLYHVSQTQLQELKGLYMQVSDLEQLKTQMIRIAAHDIRSPLGVVSGYLSLLEEELSAKAREQYSGYLEPMHRAIQRMHRMTTDVLSLERIHEAQSGAWQPLNLRDIVDRAYLDTRDQGVSKGLHLSTEVDGEEFRVRGDTVQLQEAITNLISNAIKYTDSGSVTVRLFAQDGAAVLEVEDTGMGVPEEYQASLFQPFFRVKTQETKNIDGTGLGLYLVKGIVERHRGKMRFHSVHGEGSTFGFALPLAEDSADDGAEE